jgi:hypothetical protein
MKAIRSRRLVIDACIAGSAGLSEHPVSSSCRAFLEAVRKLGHHVVFSSELSEEWHDHQSGFALRWRSSMVARKKVVWVDPVECAPVRVEIERLDVTDRRRAEIKKDVHLIEAALPADQTITSSDESARAPYREIASRVSAIRHLIWVNPTREDEQSIPWLEQGAPAQRSRRLG